MPEVVFLLLNTFTIIIKNPEIKPHSNISKWLKARYMKQVGKMVCFGVVSDT